MVPLTFINDIRVRLEILRQPGGINSFQVSVGCEPQSTFPAPRMCTYRFVSVSPLACTTLAANGYTYPNIEVPSAEMVREGLH